jgi:hypothetical protein
MKLAVRKEPGHIPGGGFHYMLFPMKMESDFHAHAFALMGYIIVETSEEDGERLLKEARAALKHQCEVALMADAAEQK